MTATAHTQTEPTRTLGEMTAAELLTSALSETFGMIDLVRTKILPHVPDADKLDDGWTMKFFDAYAGSILARLEVAKLRMRDALEALGEVQR